MSSAVNVDIQTPDFGKLQMICEMDYSFLKKDLLVYQWAECEDTTNSVETKPKSVFMEYDGQVEQEKMNEFLKTIAPDASHRVFL